MYKDLKSYITIRVLSIGYGREFLIELRKCPYNFTVDQL